MMDFHTWWSGAWHGTDSVIFLLLCLPLSVWLLSDVRSPWRLRLRQGLIRTMGLALCAGVFFALWAFVSAGPYHIRLPVLFIVDH